MWKERCYRAVEAANTWHLRANELLVLLKIYAPSDIYENYIKKHQGELPTDIEELHFPPPATS